MKKMNYLVIMELGTKGVVDFKGSEFSLINMLVECIVRLNDKGDISKEVVLGTICDYFAHTDELFKEFMIGKLETYNKLQENKYGEK